MRQRRPDICIQGAFWVVCSEKSHLMPYLVTVIPLTVTFFSYSYFFQNTKAILKRQAVHSGSQVSKRQREKMILQLSNSPSYAFSKDSEH